MNKITFEAIKDFTVSELWELDKTITRDTAIAHDFEIAGMDGMEFMNEYSKKFSVSLEGFDWVEYFGPETGGNPFSIFSYLYKRFIKKIPSRELVNLPELTIEHLMRCANEKRWSAPNEA